LEYTYLPDQSTPLLSASMPRRMQSISKLRDSGHHMKDIRSWK